MNRRPPRDPYIGTNLLDYRIEEWVGEGGMATVYRARHPQLGIKAVKVLQRSDSQLVEGFLHEASAMAALEHEHIAKIDYAGYDEAGTPFLVMPFLNGCTLESILKERSLKKQGALPKERVLHLYQQICSAVAHAHEERIIHCDLKPGNIMVQIKGGTEHLKILDFGIARVLTHTAKTVTRPMGTLQYAAPEQLNEGDRIDERADIYSLGVMLYEMLTGKVPFDGNTFKRIIAQKSQPPPRPPSYYNADLSQALDMVVSRAMSVEPEARQRTATELLRELRWAIANTDSTLIVDCTDAVTQNALAGAIVHANGDHVGQTNATGQLPLYRLLPRQYMLQVDCPRYESWCRSCELEPGEELTVIAKLTRLAQGELVLVCNVPGATVTLNGGEARLTNTTGHLHLLNVPAGAHTLRLTHPMYLPVETATEVRTWEQTLLEVTMTPRPRLVWQAIWVACTLLVVGALMTAYWRYKEPDNPRVELTPMPLQASDPRVESIPPLLRESRVHYISVDLGQGVYMELAEIPGGSFLMGTGLAEVKQLIQAYKEDGETEEEATKQIAREQPQHPVKMDGFYLGKFEVTRQQWKAIMGDYPSRTNPEQKVLPEQSCSDNCPVVNVTWDSALEFCREFSRRTGQNYRLPTEAEWEYACRANTTGLFFFGEKITPEQVNYWRDEKASAPRLLPVGSLKSANAFGLYDMHGNVWEWCFDAWHDNYFGAPEDGRSWQTLHAEKRHLIRGGAWDSGSPDCRSAYRGVSVKGDQDLGFRVARSGQ